MARNQFEKTKDSSKPDSGIMQSLEWADRKLKITMITMLVTLMKNIVNMQLQMDNISRDMEISRKPFKNARIFKTSINEKFLLWAHQ